MHRAQSFSRAAQPAIAANVTARQRNAAAWRQEIARFTVPDGRRSLIQVANTTLPFLAIMAAILVGLDQGFYVSLVLAPLAAAFLVRLFIIQHDCGHHAFFRSPRLNEALGQVIAVLTMTPFTAWKNEHAAHHATSGNLDRRGVGDITTVTVQEYLALSWWGRLSYRLYRHPLVMFGVGPAYLVLIRQRLPIGPALRQKRAWISIFGTNALIGTAITLMALCISVKAVLLGYLPVVVLAATIGVWLFYVQHQFETTYWENRAEWDFHEAAMKGCSFYDMPRVLHWLTGNIGFHHIHHLSSRIPNYRLRSCHESVTALHGARRITLLESLRCARLALWDEDGRRLVPFSAARRARRTMAAA